MSGTKIKICGLYRLCDAEYVNGAMPDYAGFVFYDLSRRCITPSKSKELREALCSKIVTVGVFVDSPKEKIAALYRENIIGGIQLHGSESDDYISDLRGMIPGAAIWKAYKIRSAANMEAAARSAADMVLLDNGYGTGECFDWSMIGGFTRPYILAGGLTPKNIPNAIDRFHPYAVDLSSGVESYGLKDRLKINAAVAAVRGG